MNSAVRTTLAITTVVIAQGPVRYHRSREVVRAQHRAPGRCPTRASHDAVDHLDRGVDGGVSDDCELLSDYRCRFAAS